MAVGKNGNPTITKMPPRSACEGCGKCCEAIRIGDALDEMIRQHMRIGGWQAWELSYTGEHSNDFTFIMANWTPISREEALRRNPHLATWQESLEGMGKEFDGFYECVNYDWETKRCKIHDNLPHVCSGYPWYGRTPHPSHLFYTDDCYYKRDIEGQYIEDGVLMHE